MIPDMLWTEDDADQVAYQDVSGLVSDEQLVVMWQILPPVDNFNRRRSRAFREEILGIPQAVGQGC